MIKKNILAEIEVSYSTNDTVKEKIESGDKAFELLSDFWKAGTLELHEEFKVILLNRANEALGIYCLSKGGITGTVVDVRLLFAVALKCNATGIIISHNHPSGNLKPSTADINLTKKIKQCSEFLDVSLIDHLIITKNGYYSFANEGLI
ncbi:JAB domain-containing protein [Flavobacterium sp. 3HN19-14]|uniref:JAB domain-containing protein n=1 Tax=Flavobacterium sp. 3HN19-14 TaxID=3448133 RepID=UPI003EE0BD75